MIRKSKRKMIIYVAVFFIILILVGITAYAKKVVENHNDNKGSKKMFTLNDMAMGTVVMAKIYHTKDITEDVMNKITDLENNNLSDRVDTSDIAHINSYAGSHKSYSPKKATIKYIEKAYELAKNSNGAFDFTLGKLTQLWNLGSNSTNIPTESEIKELLKNIGYKNVLIGNDTITTLKNMSLDFGGIGKGIACDEVDKIFSANKVLAGTISIGGSSILTYGQKPDGSPWKVAITNPRSEDGMSYLGHLSIKGTKQISTSGDYQKYVISNNKRYHHILNPKTGYPADSGMISVTVVSEEGWLSDGLSTICFVLGYEKSLELLKKYHAEAIFVDANLHVIVTDGLNDSFTLTDTSYVREE